MEVIQVSFVPSRDSKPTMVYDSMEKYLTVPLHEALNTYYTIKYVKEVLHIYNRNSKFQSCTTDTSSFTAED